MSIFVDLREQYLRLIFGEIVALRQPTKKQRSKSAPRTAPYPNFADGDSPSSIVLAEGVMKQLTFECASTPPQEQSAGTRFTELTRDYVEACFRKLAHLRPGKWEFTTKQPKELIARYDQYSHLRELAGLTERYPEIAAVLGRNYFVKPDIVVSRSAVSDAEINENEPLVAPEDQVARHSPLRRTNVLDCGSDPRRKTKALVPQLFHASISCKWTLRSDRAQNARTEALNLMRNRKGRSPHIVVVTMEPLPSRIASIALGTGDIDCTYHATLYELLAAARVANQRDAYEFLQEMVAGRRLRDLSDLAFDLAT